MHPNTKLIMEWIDTMTDRYGGVVYDREGRQYTWGQALLRECLGPDWAKLSSKDPCDVPSDHHAFRAMKWQAGAWPEWVDRQRMVQYRVREAGVRLDSEDDGYPD